MRIIYKGIRSGKSRVAIITYADNEENKAYDIAINIRNMTSYKVDTGVSGMIIIDVDDMNDYNNLKEWYKEFKKTSCDETSTENDNEESNNTKENDNETATDSADNNETPNKTPAELKAEINKKYGVNAVYYDTDSILCDAEKQNVCVQHNTYKELLHLIDNNETTNKTSQTCNIKAYCDGKELSVPYSEYKCVEHALEYIHSLYINRVVSYDTVFIMKLGSQAKEYTIHTLIGITDLIQYNIDDINHGLKHDSYKYVRDGVNRICDIITDNMKIVIDLNKTLYCTITKSRYDGYYRFKFVKTVYTKKPSDFARWLYTQTFTHRIDLKCWYRDLK